MREILFRGKRLDAGEWVEGCLVKFGKESFTDDDRYGIMGQTVLVAKLHKDLSRYRCLRMGDCDYIYHNIRIAEIIPKTVGQFTGLTDKNGKKIFEGDIIKIPDDYDEYGHNAGEIYEVYFCFGGFRLKPKYSKARGYWLEDDETVEVIGNIHDNPELLVGTACDSEPNT